MERRDAAPRDGEPSPTHADRPRGAEANQWRLDGGHTQTPAGTPSPSLPNGRPWYDITGAVLHGHGAGILHDPPSGPYYWYGEDRAAATLVNAGASLNNQPSGGIRCYSSTDLLAWAPLGTVWANDRAYPVVERPKVLRCPATGTYVLYCHFDRYDYAVNLLGVFTAASAAGPFTLRARLRPDGRACKDLTAFQDDNGDGWLYWNDCTNLRAARLSADYLSVGPSTALAGLATANMEAPAVFKRGTTYYLLASQSTGWAFNTNYAHKAAAPDGPWINTGNPFRPCTAEPNVVAYRSQTAFVLKTPSGRYVYLGDRWEPSDLAKSTCVWLPLTFDGVGTPAIAWAASWAPEPPPPRHGSDAAGGVIAAT